MPSNQVDHMLPNLKNYDWSLAEEALAKVLGDHPIRISDAGYQGLICSGDKLMAILKVYKDEPHICLHLRASLLPNAAAYIAAVVGHVLKITIDETFEYDFDGNMLTGVAAIEFASENIKDLWYGFEEKKSGEKYGRPKHLN